ncbi:hypothetical protein ACFP1Z_30900 [Streptomyces gamaensis]|uniref:Uncharacterized protein n=1 Tax=Streptomyces gamaensis TaxID=1763542 RepID=A0ABW0Z7B1_9ACTN
MSVQRRLPAEFTAFHTLHHRAYLEHARARLPLATHARQAVDRTFHRLASTWADVLRQPSVEARALAVLDEEITKLSAAGNLHTPAARPADTPRPGSGST